MAPPADPAWVTDALAKGWKKRQAEPGVLCTTVNGVLVKVRELPLAGLRLSASAFRSGELGLVVRRRTSRSQSQLQLGQSFDAAFVVNGNDHDLIRAWFDPALIRCFRDLARTNGDFSLTLAAGQITADFGPDFAAPTTWLSLLPAMATLVSSVALASERLIARWNELRRQLAAEPAERTRIGWPPAPIRIVRGAGSACIELHKAAGAWKTRLTFSSLASSEVVKPLPVQELAGVIVDEQLVRKLVARGFETLMQTAVSRPYR